MLKPVPLEILLSVQEERLLLKCSDEAGCTPELSSIQHTSYNSKLHIIAAQHYIIQLWLLPNGRKLKPSRCMSEVAMTCDVQLDLAVMCELVRVSEGTS